MPFIFEQPNLDRAAESHLYFDPGDGRLITVFTDEARKPDPDRTSTDMGCVHHIAFAVSRATFQQAVDRLNEREIRNSGVKDRGFMDSIYFEDPLGLLIELASYRFEPPAGHTHAEVLMEARRIRVARSEYAMAEEHLADAIEALVERTRPSLSTDGVAGIRTEHPREKGGTLVSAIKLNVIKPSVNNLTARVFVRAAGLDFSEHDVYGLTRSAEYLARAPSHLTPMIETADLPKGVLWESYDHAVSLQQARAQRLFLSEGSRGTRNDRQRHVLPDRHLLSLSRARHLSGAQVPTISRRSRL